MDKEHTFVDILASSRPSSTYPRPPATYLSLIQKALNRLLKDVLNKLKHFTPTARRQDADDKTSLPPKENCQATELCLWSTYFQFRNCSTTTRRSCNGISTLLSHCKCLRGEPVRESAKHRHTQAKYVSQVCG